MRHRRRLKRLIDLKVVDSSYNWACSLRYAIATMAKYETVLFLDDDFVLLEKDFVQRMYGRFRKLGSKDILSCWTNIWAEWDDKSEEHTSELQSLMRISYAVFCLKKKKTKEQSETTKNIK